jgi:hypothetical protein
MRGEMYARHHAVCGTERTANVQRVRGLANCGCLYEPDLRRHGDRLLVQRRVRAGSNEVFQRRSADLHGDRQLEQRRDLPCSSDLPRDGMRVPRIGTQPVQWQLHELPNGPIQLRQLWSQLSGWLLFGCCLPAVFTDYRRRQPGQYRRLEQHGLLD